MIHKYCLFGYTDKYKKVINDFSVTYHSQQPNSKGEKGYRKTNSVNEYIGKAQALMQIDDINLRNPEYILNLLIEDTHKKENMDSAS